MRAAVIENDIVTNVIVVDPDRLPFPVVLLDDALPVQIGDTYDGADFYRDGEKVVVPEPVGADEYIEALRILGVEV